MAYREAQKAKKEQNPNQSQNFDEQSPNQPIDDRAKLALERAMAYKEALKSKKEQNPGLEGKNEKKEEINDSKVSSVFPGLDIADKKNYSGFPPGLNPISDYFSEGGDFPEVEIIVGDSSKFMNKKTSESEPQAVETKPDVEDDGTYLYKPTVTTWGVFPRPINISKTYGGGRNIKPGDVLETEEQKAAREERTRQMLTAYNRKIGLEVDPEVEAECQKELDEGNSFMDSGYLKEAIPFYEKVMKKMVFKTELHGLAALNWAICQDSLLRPNEARVMYKKLKSHPNPDVKTKARHFSDSFQAMEFLKVSGANPFLNVDMTSYQNWNFADKYRTSMVVQGEEEDAMSQILPYIFFLFSPLLMVLYIAVQKGHVN